MKNPPTDEDRTGQGTSGGEKGICGSEACNGAYLEHATFRQQLVVVEPECGVHVAGIKNVEGRQGTNEGR